jgi:thiamine pyrophosphokinase
MFLREVTFKWIIYSCNFNSYVTIFYFFFPPAASVRVAVDGGANCWFHFLQGSECVVPDLVVGDFDSVKQDVLSYFRSKGAEVIQTPDQDETDFTKALRQIESLITRQNLQVCS